MLRILEPQVGEGDPGPVCGLHLVGIGEIEGIRLPPQQLFQPAARVRVGPLVLFGNILAEQIGHVLVVCSDLRVRQGQPRVERRLRQRVAPLTMVDQPQREMTPRLVRRSLAIAQREIQRRSELISLYEMNGQPPERRRVRGDRIQRSLEREFQPVVVILRLVGETGGVPEVLVELRRLCEVEAECSQVATLRCLHRQVWHEDEVPRVQVDVLVVQTQQIPQRGALLGCHPLRVLAQHLLRTSQHPT